MANTFVTDYYFSKLIRKISPTHNLFDVFCILCHHKMCFSPLDSGVIVIFMDMTIILVERPITLHCEYAIKLCTHCLKSVGKALDDQEIGYFLV